MIQEEAGIDAPLCECGTLFFHVPGVESAFDIHLFVANEYSGEVIEYVTSGFPGLGVF